MGPGTIGAERGPLADPVGLAGRWEWTRRVEDRVGGTRLSASGTLELRPVGPDLLTWAESGLLDRPDGTKVEVRRALRLERRDEGWWVAFEDGRDFHPWTPGTPVVHPCVADTYRGLVTVTAVDPPRWRVVWEVSGPAKDHTIVTDLGGWVALSAVSRRVDP